MPTDTKPESPVNEMEEALPAGTKDAGAEDGPIRIVLPSGMILETYPKHMRKNIADLFGKIRFADGYDPRAPWGGFPPPPASSEPFSLAPGQGVTLAELEAELEAEER